MKSNKWIGTLVLPASVLKTLNIIIQTQAVPLIEILHLPSSMPHLPLSTSTSLCSSLYPPLLPAASYSQLDRGTGQSLTENPRYLKERMQEIPTSPAARLHQEKGKVAST